MTETKLPPDQIEAATHEAEQGGPENRDLLADVFKGLSADDAYKIMRDMTSVNSADIDAGTTKTKITAKLDSAPFGPDRAMLLSRSGLEIDVQDATGFDRLMGKNGPTETALLYKAPDFSPSAIAKRYESAGVEFASILREPEQKLTRIATSIKNGIEGHKSG